MNSIALYFKMISVSIRSQLQYRASFVMMSIATFFSGFVDYLAIWALFARFDRVGGWTLYEVGVVYGIAHMAFALSEAFVRTFDIFGRHVRTGEFDRVLLRPRTTALQMLGGDFQIIRVGRFLQGLLVLIISKRALPIAWNVSHYGLVLFSVIGGALLFSGVIVLQATSCFFAVESLEAWNIITYGGLNATQYPLSLYHKPIRYFCMFIVPIALANYWPCSYLLQKGYVADWFAIMSPALGFAFFALSLVIWNLGTKHYTSTGS